MLRALHTGAPARPALARAALAAVLAMLFLSGPARAQLDTGKPPPPVIMTDQNSVDLKSGQFVDAQKPLGAGAADAPAVAYTPIDANYNNNVGTPLVGWIQHYTCGLSDDGCVEYLVARLGNRTITFQRPPYTYNLTSFTGERLVSDPTLGVVIYDNDDTAWIFDGAFAGSDNESYIYQTGTLQKIIYRDGRTLTYARATNTDMSVTSNQGYQLIVRSGQSNVKLVNTAVDYCNIYAPSCTFTQNWPTFTRSGSNTPIANGQIWTTNAADPMSRTTTIAVKTIFGVNGYTDTDIYKPGGLHQYFRKKSVLLYNQSGQSASAIVVTNYSDDFGSSTYSYSSTLAQLGTITHAVSTHSNGSVLTFNNYFDDNSLTDELGNATHYYFGSNTMQPWSYSRIETLLGGVKYPEQGQLTYWYDYRGNILQTDATPKPGSGQSAVSSASSYRATCVEGKTCNIADYTIDARNARTDYTYNAGSGMMLTKTLPADANGVRQETRYTWQQMQAVYKQSPGGSPVASGSPIWKLVATSTCRTMAGAACVGTADEVRVTYGYNGNLLPISETVQAGDGSLVATTTRDYDYNGNVLWVDGPAAGTVDRTYYFWNANREPIGEIGPDPDGASPLPFPATRRTFDSEGRVTLIETGTATAQTLAALNAMTVYQSRATSYDKRGRKLTERRNGGSDQTLVQYSYGYKGLLECTAVRMNPAVYNALPASACTLGAQGSFGPDRITKNVYDAAGRVIQTRKAVGIPAYEQVYAAYSYNADGKVTSVTDANGNKATMTYDGFDRQKRWYFPSPTTAGQTSATDYEEYGYDVNGNRTSFRKRDGRTFAYSFDNLNRVIFKNVPSGGCTAPYTCATPAASAVRDVYYGYDLLGHMLSARFDSANGADGVSSTFDALGRLKSSTTAMGGYTRTFGYDYDIRGNRTRITHPDTSYFTYSYDRLDRLVGVSESGTAVIATINFDAAGRRANITRGAVTTTYGYDTLARLTSISDNPAGTAADLTSSLSYTPANQIATRARSNDSYAFGNYTSVNRVYSVNGLNQYASVAGTGFTYDSSGNLTGDGASTYGYDAENRLVSMSGGLTAQLVYDPMGRLFRAGNGAGTQFLNDGDDLTAEYAGATGTLVKRYVHGADKDDPLIQYSGAALGSTYRASLQSDHQGSIVSVADAGGTATSINKYDEYGIPGSGNAGRFQFTGQAWMPEIGMYYYKARIYSPTLGRFLQTDPVGYKDQVNLYSYVSNDPVNGADPYGLYTTTCVSGTSAQCAAATTEFETQRQRNLQSTDRAVVAAAQAFGDPGKDNGVHVEFKSQDQMDTQFARTRGTHVPGHTESNINGSTVTATVSISVGARDREMGQAIAHEGTHLVQDNAFAATWDARSGTYSSSADMTVLQSEMQAYSAGAAVLRYTMFNNLRGQESYIRSHYGHPDASAYAAFPMRP